MVCNVFCVLWCYVIRPLFSYTGSYIVVWEPEYHCTTNTFKYQNTVKSYVLWNISSNMIVQNLTQLSAKIDPFHHINGHPLAWYAYNQRRKYSVNGLGSPLLVACKVFSKNLTDVPRRDLWIAHKSGQHFSVYNIQWECKF